MEAINTGVNIMLIVYGVGILVSILIISLLIVRRINIKKKEDFEKRNN